MRAPGRRGAGSRQAPGRWQAWRPPWSPQVRPAQVLVPAGLAIGVARRERLAFAVGQAASSASADVKVGTAKSYRIDRPYRLREGAVQGDGGGLAEGELDPFLRRLRVVLQPPLTRLLAPAGPLPWPAPLRPFQRDGIALLVARGALLLADDMGLGKTIQTAAALRVLAYRDELSAGLVVCPASLLTQWRRELHRWAPELRVVEVRAPAAERPALWRLPAHVHLVSYETLRADVLERAESPVLGQPWDVLVLDEASRIRTPHSALTVACRQVPADRRWALTGTPLENRPGDLASLLDFLHVARAPGDEPADLREALARVQLRRRKGEVLRELPPAEVHELHVELGAEQAAAYQRAEREGVLQLRAEGPEVSLAHVLALILRLKQLCNADPVTGQSAKLADLVERVRTVVDEGHRALVFSQFTDPVFGVAAVARALQAFRPLSFTGDLSTPARERVLETFRHDPSHRVLVLSLRAGGVGLNLQEASYVFHLDRWWNPAVEQQADSRAHRLGQRGPVTIYRYLCVDTIEERIDTILKTKQALFASLVDDVTLPIDAALTRAELMGLFGDAP